MTKTFREFAEKWLPFHARKERFSPNSYDSYRSNLENHIYPFFGDRVMSSITAEDIDNFIDHLSMKPCRGPKSYGKRLDNIPTLSSSSVKKCYTVLMAGFETALKWHYIASIPHVTAPAEKNVKRRAWEAGRVYEVLQSIQEDKLLHLVVHLAFVCSLRAGEIAGIDIRTIDVRDRCLWIRKQDRFLHHLLPQRTPHCSAHSASNRRPYKRSFCHKSSKCALPSLSLPCIIMRHFCKRISH